MRNVRVVAAPLLAVATLGCVGSNPSESSSNTRSRASVCPVLATACGAGCYPVRLEPVDVAGACLLPPQTVGCTSFGGVGSPAMGCSVTPDGTIWISRANAYHPAGRVCTKDEWPFVSVPVCSTGR